MSETDTPPAAAAGPEQEQQHLTIEQMEVVAVQHAIAAWDRATSSIKADEPRGDREAKIDAARLHIAFAQMIADVRLADYYQRSAGIGKPRIMVPGT